MAKTKRHRALERAAKNFVFIPPINISRKEMIITLPPTVRDQIIKRLAKEGKVVKGIDFRVRLFGDFHETEFKRQCLTPRSALRSYTDKTGTPTRRMNTGRAASPRVLLVSLLPDWLRQTERMKAYANAMFADFLPHYDEYLESGRTNVDQNFPFKVEWKGHKVPVSEVISDPKFTPSREQFADAFKINIPSLGNGIKRLTIDDWTDVDLPAELMDRYSEDALDALEEQLDNAKERLIAKALKVVNRVEDQLTKDADKLRPFKSIITDAAELGESLRGLVDGYDPSDLQLRNAAITLTEKIGEANIDAAGEPTTERWKNSVAARQEAVRAARAAGKVLKASQKILDKKREAAAPAADTSPSELVDGGMLADIL